MKLIYQRIGRQTMSEKETNKGSDGGTDTGTSTETTTNKEITNSGVSAADLASLRDTLLERLETINKTKESPEKDTEVGKLNQRIDKLTDALVDFGKGITDEIRGKKAVGDTGSTKSGTENKMEVKTPRSGQAGQEGQQEQVGRGFWRRVLG
jgi:hypothetical protein